MAVTCLLYNVNGGGALVARILMDRPLPRGSLLQLPMANPKDLLCAVYIPGCWRIASEPEVALMPGVDYCLYKIWVNEVGTVRPASQGKEMDWIREWTQSPPVLPP